MDLIQNFLAKLSVIEYKYRTLEAEKEQFNIFTALHKERDEVKLHSRFISVLLSPASTHRKKDIFLKHFLQIVGISDFDTSSSSVYPTEYGKSEYHEIDILVRNNTQAIIIENKIDAGDSNHEDRGQLEGYFNLINNDGISKENIRVFYLTLDRHDPSAESLGKYESLENINGATIDYEREIQDWLNLCLKECVNQPFLRESIIQYINLIKRMTNNIELQERLDIRDLIAKSEENMNSAKLLVDNYKHVKWQTAWDFWCELADALEQVGCKITERPTLENITNTTHYEAYKKGYNENNKYGLYFSIQNILLYVWNIDEDTENCWLAWGIDQTNSDEIKEKVNELARKKYDKDSLLYSDILKNGLYVWFQLGSAQFLARHKNRVALNV